MPTASEDVTEIQNPRRVLVVGMEDQALHLSRVVKDLTGSVPSPLAGSTQDFNLKTAYYKATVPLWIDLIVTPSEWSTAFLSEEAKEVLGVLGGLVVVFPVPTTTGAEQTRDLISCIGEVVKQGLGGWEWDGVGLAVGIGEGQTDEWDEMCAEAGLEFVHLINSQKPQDRNEFGEKSGIPRVVEALEANDWAQLDSSALSDFGDFQDGTQGDKDEKEEDVTPFDPESLDFGFDRADFEGLKKAIWSSGVEADEEPSEATRMTTIAGGEDGPKGLDNGEKLDLDDQDIAKLDDMMRKLQAVREAGDGMPLEQRRRVAARAVEEVMRELS